MNTKQENRIVHALGRLLVAVQGLVTSAAQLVDDSQTITGTTMTLANSPTFVYGVYLNGQRLTLTADYTISTVTVTFGWALAADKVTVVYKY